MLFLVIHGKDSLHLKSECSVRGQRSIVALEQCCHSKERQATHSGQFMIGSFRAFGTFILEVVQEKWHSSICIISALMSFVFSPGFLARICGEIGRVSKPVYLRIRGMGAFLSTSVGSEALLIIA